MQTIIFQLTQLPRHPPMPSPCAPRLPAHLARCRKRHLLPLPLFFPPFSLPIFEFEIGGDPNPSPSAALTALRLWWSAAVEPEPPRPPPPPLLPLWPSRAGPGRGSPSSLRSSPYHLGPPLPPSPGLRQPAPADCHCLEHRCRVATALRLPGRALAEETRQLVPCAAAIWSCPHDLPPTLGGQSLPPRGTPVAAKVGVEPRARAQPVLAQVAPMQPPPLPSAVTSASPDLPLLATTACRLRTGRQAATGCALASPCPVSF